jgi:hypothetical protein
MEKLFFEILFYVHDCLRTDELTSYSYVLQLIAIHDSGEHELIYQSLDVQRQQQ